MDALRLPLKGILVEKPLGHTAASGRRILEAIKAKGLPMAVPHGLLAKRTPTEIIERVQRGEIGDLKLVEIQNSGWDIINAGKETTTLLPGASTFGTCMRSQSYGTALTPKRRFRRVVQHDSWGPHGRDLSWRKYPMASLLMSR